MLKITAFTACDIPRAAQLTKLTWGEEMSLPDEALKSVLYEAMVRYYFRSTEFSFKAADEAGMQGFLLAAPLQVRDSLQQWLAHALASFGTEAQDLVYNYLRYLSYNGQKVRELAQEQDLLLCLFLSRKRGVGSALLQNVEEAARTQGIRNLYLWADATCDYVYYRRRGCVEVAHFTNALLPQLGAQATWVYKKEVKGCVGEK